MCSGFLQTNRISVRSKSYVWRKERNYGKLVEVGKLKEPKLKEKYSTGDLFLHRLLGYRGVILFPWVAQVYDRDAKDIGMDDVKIKATSETYYQALMDARDWPYAKNQVDAVSFLGNRETGGNLYVLPGLDYVAHEDIVPYLARDKQVISHELFDKFLSYDGKMLKAKETLSAWHKKNYQFLELTEVHKETTEGIKITIIPFYMGSRIKPNSVYWWRYCVRIENLGQLSVQLMERHWRIFSLNGTLESIKGRGVAVVGHKPLLSKESPVFQYSHHVYLQSPSGHMWGTFRMEREDGYNFDCKIPPFSLESKSNSIS